MTIGLVQLGQGLGTADPALVFWLVVYAAMLTPFTLWLIGHLLFVLKQNKRLTWDMHCEYIDLSEFSNRNIPLKISYKGTEPQWLWVAYVSLHNTGRVEICAEDSPERQGLIIGQEGCRYIGFNHLLSAKAKVNLSPLFKEDSVWCKVEFDRLGPGDEILLSLIYVADAKHRLDLQGALFGRGSQLISGYRTRLVAWRSLWWLLITVVLAGTLGGWVFLRSSLEQSGVVTYQFQIMVILYLLALMTTGLLLRPIRFWQQIPERFHEQHERRRSAGSWLRFILGLSDEL